MGVGTLEGVMEMDEGNGNVWGKLLAEDDGTDDGCWVWGWGC